MGALMKRRRAGERRVPHPELVLSEGEGRLSKGGKSEFLCLPLRLRFLAAGGGNHQAPITKLTANSTSFA
jgi:hypothetical protein